jgi:VIT1/CCC1 family predicted Fe2+/Mn2+ transporter
MTEMDHDHHPSASEHRSLGHGGLRAGVFGASDGLVSNMALVLGVASATPDAGLVVLAGVAGLLAGAFSMAAGEWISVKAQREALERELQMEKDHLERYPEAERAHLMSVLAKAGLSQGVSAAVVAELSLQPHVNLDFHARMELGIDPSELGSPLVAAGTSFVAFSVGALVPLVPWLLPIGDAALPATLLVSCLALFGVGAALALFTSRPWVLSGLRQLLIGAAATAVTMLVSRAVGGVALG